MAHTRPWDETDPDNTDEARFYAQELRETKVDTRERLEVDHEFGNQILGGQHKKVTLIEGTDPAAVADRIIVYGKETGGRTELFSRDSAGGITQLTKQGIAPSGDDHSANEAEMKLTANPGITGSVNLPTTNSGEIEVIRRVLRRLCLGDVPKVATGAVEAGWFDGVQKGTSLLKNSAFMDGEAASAPLTAPFGWQLINSSLNICTYVALETNSPQGDGFALELRDSNIGPFGGIQQVVTGIRAGERYLVICAIRPTVGVWRLLTTGADISSGLPNLALSSGTATSAWEVLCGVVQATATAGNITVFIQANSGLARAQIASCKVVRLGVDHDDRMVPSLRQFKTSAAVGNDIATLNATTLITVHPPGDNYQISVNASISFISSGSNVWLEERVDSGAWVTVHSLLTSNQTGLATFKHDRNVVIGETYSYRLSASNANGFLNLAGSTMLHRISVDMVAN